MLLSLLALGAALPAGILLERAVPTAAGRPTGRFRWVAVGAHLSLLAACFGLSWRPLFGAACYLALVGALTFVSRAKHGVMRENLVFSDLFLARTILRHPRLYYLHLADPRIALGGLAGLLAAGFWLALEPSLLPSPPLAFALATLPLLAGLAGLVATAAVAGPRIGAAVLDDPDASAAIDKAIAAAGLLGSLVALCGAWARRSQMPAAPILAPEPRASGRTEAKRTAGRTGPLVIAVQCESFLDPRGRGVDAPPLDALDRAAGRARAYGRLQVPAFAANTMRAEFSFLTGLPNETLGADRFNPYLRAAAHSEAAWPARLRQSGWRTLFVHPYDRHFFERDEVMPALGFERALWIEDFADAPRRGPYVSDLAVAERILREARAAPGPAFIFAVTMENHGPWSAGRLPGVGSPLERFLHHLSGADSMIGALVDGIDAWPGQAVLCLYGDHVPALRGLGAEAEEGLTDYLIVEGRDSPRAPQGGRAARRRKVEDLLAMTLVGLRENPF